MKTLSGMVRCSYKVPLWARIFHFVTLSFRSLKPELAHANEINHDIL